MQSINLRDNLIASINTLPTEMLDEVHKFLEFLEYKHHELSKEQVLKNLEKSVKEMNMIKEGKLEAISINELLDEL